MIGHDWVTAAVAFEMVLIRRQTLVSRRNIKRG